MANRNKTRGTAWETAVADYLNESLGLYKAEWREGDRSSRWLNPRDPDNVTRNVQTGAKDIGDLSLWPFIGECKDEQTIRLPAYIRQANQEAANATADYGVALVKQRGKGVAQGYAVMDIATFARVLQALRGQ